MALDRLLSHGMLTLITIFCCKRQPHDAVQKQESIANQFQSSEKKKLKQREVSEMIEGTVQPLLLYLHCPLAVISPKPTRKLAKTSRDRSVDPLRRIGWLVIAKC